MKNIVKTLICSLSLIWGAAQADASSLKVNVRDYGAKGNGKTLNTDAFNRAIAYCGEQGGGTVIVPSGTFLTGTIRLQSHVSLHLEKGAVIKGSSELKDYMPYVPSKDMGKYDNADKYNWNRALILGFCVDDVSIYGEGTVDGSHVFDSTGEENMRGPHTILFGESRNITLSGFSIVHASNYAFMAYEIENATFQHLTIKEGWDGIHIRGGKNILIRNSEFHTGDDAIAGGHWENMTITDCFLNSSCNGIRVIMPATKLTIARCTFQGPGLFPHRTSKELKRTNTLCAILIQPGGWGKAPGRMDEVFIHDVTMDNVDTPFTFVLNQGNDCGTIEVERVKATRINKAASSIESWKGGTYEHILLRDISIEYVGHDDPSLRNIQIGQPGVDTRIIPCWGWFIRNVKKLTCENIRLSYTGTEMRPALILDNVATPILNRVECRQVEGVEPLLLQNSGEIGGEGLTIFPLR